MTDPGAYLRQGIPSPPGTVKYRRISLPVQATVGAAQTASFTFAGVPQDEIWTGSLRIPGATPATVLPILWTAFDGGVPIGEWYNSQSSGRLQVGTQLTVTGSGVSAGSLTAYFQGIATDRGSAPVWWPEPTPAPPLPSLSPCSILPPGLPHR